MAKKVYDDGSSLNGKILNGVNKLADAVSATLGPKGRNVIIHSKGKNPIITKDGVTVANAIELEDPFENLGAQVLKQASAVTAQEAGDGTTTATVLARAIVMKAQKYITAGASPVELKRGMDKATVSIVEHLAELAKPIRSVEDIEHIATISANGDKQLGKLVALAVDKVGKDGAVSIEEAKSVETSLDVIEGFQLPSGYLSPQFVNDERRGVMRFDDIITLVTDHSVENLEELMPALEIAARENKPFIIFAESVEGQALAALILNTVRGNMRIGVVKAPRYGEERRNILKDIALVTGSKFFSRESGIALRECRREHLGSAKTIESLKNHTTVVGGGGNYKDVAERIETLKAELSQTEDLRECEPIQDRITRLASGVAIIRVGGLTEVDMVERKHRIEDALEAVKSAQLEGVLPGGGIGLLRAVNLTKLIDYENEDQRLGAQIIYEACKEPLRRLCSNCDARFDIIFMELRDKETWQGYNFATGRYAEMDKEGIIDPAKVTRCALQNAVSAAATLLTTSYAIIEQ